MQTDASAIESTAKESEGELIAKHDSRVRALARRFANIDVDDLFQVGRLALIEAARAWETKPHVSQFWTYARRAVLGAMFDYATREIGHRAIGDDFDVSELVDVNGAGPEDELEVKRVFESLDDVEIEIIRLRVRDGLDFITLASRLGRSPSGVKRIFASAVATLRERAAASVVS